MKLKTKTLFATLAVLLMAAFAGTAFGEQPDKWVRYVEATGSQYVDTGIIGRWNTKAECKVEWMEFADASFLASRAEPYPGNGRLYFCYCLNGEGKMYTAQDDGETVGWQKGNDFYYTWFELNRVYTYTAEFSATNDVGESTNKIKVDNWFDVWNKTKPGIDTGYNLYIFANNQKGSATGHSKTRCYGLKIWQGPKDGGDMVLVRDFQPCMKNGKAGLYDAVSSNIFYSASGKDLVCDENSEVPDEYIDYVESTGSDAFSEGQLHSYIDTGIIGRSGTKMRGEFAILKDEDGALVGSRKGDNRFYMLHSYWSKLTCGYGGHKSNSKALELGKRYWAETEFNVGSQTEKIWSDGVTNTLYSGTDNTSIDTGYPMYLFACNVNGQPRLDGNVSMAAKARCYGLKIWQNGVLVRDFRPCLKNGVAGLYDDVSGRIFYSSGTPLSYETRKAVKAKEVQFVEYIESDGHNTLDTFVPARSGTRAKGDVMWTEHPAWWNYAAYRYLRNNPLAPLFWRQSHAYLAGVKPSVKNSSGTPIAESKFFMVHLDNQHLDVGYGTSGLAYAEIDGATVTPQEYEKCSFDVTVANGTQTVIWNGTNALAGTITGDVDTGDTLHLFSSGFWRHRSAARCYGLQLWQGNADGSNMQLVRDFKPCIYENKGMLYDTVTKMVYRPSPDIPVSRTGAVIFTGDEKPAQYVEYVESDGTIFVDTGVIGKAGTAAELDVTFLKDEDKGCLESRNGNTRFYLFHNGGSTYGMGYGYGSYYNMGAMETGVRYHVESSLFTGSQVVKVNGTTMANAAATTAYDTDYSMYLFASHVTGAVGYPGSYRFYGAKIWQGNADGSNLQLLRDFKPVKLANGLVVLWDFANNVPYLPQVATSRGTYTTFPVVGPDGERIYTGTRLIVR